MTAQQFPPPPERKACWPWTAEPDSPACEVLPGKTWPKISIVTPSFNQGNFLEETIRSILLQGYPDLEYLIMDGGSTDGSDDIIRKYEPWFAYWVSEKDNGQADAIYRGFERATGNILGWVNSDDFLLPGSLWKVGKFFADNPGIDCVVGGAVIIDAEGRVIVEKDGLPRCHLGMETTHHRLLFHHCGTITQPATFWRRNAFFAAGGFDRSLRFCFDYDMYLRLSQHKPFGRIEDFLAAFRLHETSKSLTIREVAQAENELLWRRYGRYGKSVLYRKLYRSLYHKKGRAEDRLIRKRLSRKELVLPSCFRNTGE